MKHATKILSLALVIALCVTVLASCAPIDFVKNLINGAPSDDPQEALAALRSNGYTAEISESDGIISVSGYMPLDYNNSIEIQYFSDSYSADTLYDFYKDVYEDMKDNIGEDYIIGRSGTVVWIGHKDAIKAAK